MLFLPAIQQENCIHAHMISKHVSRFSEPQQDFQNLNKVFKTLIRFIYLQQSNTLDLLRTEEILEKG